MANAEYDSRVDDLVDSCKKDIYDGVLVDDVLPAIRTYAYASLQGMADEYDVPATFPVLPARVELPDHYGNALFARGSGGHGVQHEHPCYGAGSHS